MDRLILRDKIGLTWLIQRLKKPRKNSEGGVLINPFSFGGGLRNGGLSDDAMSLISDIFAFDYMGSAEFEFGAVPAALHFLGKQASESNLVSGSLDLSGKSVYYMCPKPYEAEVRTLIIKLSKKPYAVNLKERCGLYESLNPRNEWDAKNVGWLELDNGFMFFTDAEMFEQVTKLFGVQSEVQKDS